MHLCNSNEGRTSPMTKQQQSTSYKSSNEKYLGHVQTKHFYHVLLFYRRLQMGGIEFIISHNVCKIYQRIKQPRFSSVRQQNISEIPYHKKCKKYVSYNFLVVMLREMGWSRRFNICLIRRFGFSLLQCNDNKLERHLFMLVRCHTIVNKLFGKWLKILLQFSWSYAKNA